MNKYPAERKMKHGCNRRDIRTPEYATWASMIQRCLNSKSVSYRKYGARGITVCNRWLVFERFMEDMGSRPSSKHSLDRIDNDGNYEPGNCRWATQSEQNRNQRRNVWITAFGRTQCLLDWSKETGIAYQIIRRRLKRGMGPEQALTAKLEMGGRVRLVTAFGKTQRIKEWSLELGLNADLISGRLAKGWAPERALT